MFAFGHGLSYTTFAYSDLELEGGETVTATFRVTNTGGRRGADVPQVYLTGAPDERRCRLLGFERLELDPGESHTVSVAADPRPLARLDGRTGRWRIADGAHQIAVGKEAGAWEMTGEAELEDRSFGS